MKAMITGKLRRPALVLLVGTLLLAGAQVLTPQTSAAKITWGKVTGTIYFNKVETKDFATASLAGGGVCAAVANTLKASKNPYVLAGLAACEVYAGALKVQAERAMNHNMCLKIKYAPAPNLPGVIWVPDIYRGDYCR